MASVNKSILLGNCGADPEVRYMPDGKVVATVSIATTKKFKDKDGQKQERTEWHRAVFFNKLAEIVGEYVKKGASIYVEGELRTRKWEKDGVTHYTTEIVGSEMQMLGSRDGGQDARPRQSSTATTRQTPPPAPQPDNYDDFDDDIPF